MTTSYQPNVATSITQCGLPGISTVPFGMHACHFYRTRNELVAALAPYFLAGLRGNERCHWITAAPLAAVEAMDVLRNAWKGVDDALQSGALQVLDFDEWYVRLAKLKGLDVVQMWLEEEERALAEGYSGLRVSGNTSFVTPDEWPMFMEYEHAVSSRLIGRRIVALCSYALSQCQPDQVNDVMHAHHCTLKQPDDEWQVAIGSATPV